MEPPKSLPLSGLSPAEWLALQSASLRQAFLSSLTSAEKASLSRQWRGWYARPKQLAPPGHWTIWLVLAGRGFGKTRTGAEWVREKVGPRDVPSDLRIVLAGRTAADVRDVMIDGPSGILATSPPWNRPKWVPSKRRLLWPNGAVGITLSADKPDQFRGPQYHLAWAEEVASWRYTDSWDQLRFGNRLPDVTPQFCVTTTPRPTELIRSLLEEPALALTRGSTYENSANLAPTFLEAIRHRYEGTRLGRQEIEAEILDDTPGALWTRATLERAYTRTKPDLVRIVVAVDPAVSSSEESSETGIVVAGVDELGDGFVLEDLSGRYTPHGWATKAVEAYVRYEADHIIAEVNNGGALVEHTVRTVSADVAYRAVRASRGKHARAEPVAALYEQGRVHHVGAFAELEDQQCTWIPGDPKAKSPDRLDALVWGLSDLMLGVAGGGGLLVVPSSRS